MLIKKKINFKGNDVNIRLPLSTNNNIIGEQQSINKFIENETGLSINPAVDGEKFRYRLSGFRTLRFNFLSNNNYDNTLLNNGFVAEDFNINSTLVNNSFYIMQVYDSVNTENQTLLHASFINGYSFVTSSTSDYLFSDSVGEYSSLYISENFIKNNSGNQIPLYIKFLFFNAKTGNIIPFINNENQSRTDELRQYLTIILLVNEKRYALGSSSPIIEFNQIPSGRYSNKVSNSINKINNFSPNFPDGGRFVDSGNYEEISI